MFKSLISFFRSEKTSNSDDLIRNNLDIENILSQLNHYFQIGDFNKAIALCLKTVNSKIEDYRIYSALCRSYRRLLPIFVLDYNSIPDTQINISTNNIVNSIKFGEKSLIILLDNYKSEDNDLTLSSYCLTDINDAYNVYIQLINQKKARNLGLESLFNLDSNTKQKLSNLYQKGFPVFDNKFLEFQRTQNLFDEFKKILSM